MGKQLTKLDYEGWIDGTERIILGVQNDIRKNIDVVYHQQYIKDLQDRIQGFKDKIKELDI